MSDDFANRISEGRGDIHIRETQDIGSSVSITPLLRKFVVLDTIVDPIDVSQNPEKYSAKFTALGASNILRLIRVIPRNSIIGKPLEVDGGGTAMLLFPFFSHLSFPCKAGEVVWVIFESSNVQDNIIGFWLSRVPDFLYVDDVNHTHYPRKWDPSLLPRGSRDTAEGTVTPVFEFPNGAVVNRTDGTRDVVPSSQFIEGDNDVFKTILTESDASKVTSYESVPRYNKRPGDFAFEGSNNTLIVLGTERQGPSAKIDDETDGTRKISVPESDIKMSGTIDIVAGRGQTAETSGKTVDNNDMGRKELDKSVDNLQPNEGDPDLLNDRSRLLISVGTGSTIDKSLNPALDELHIKVSSAGTTGDAELGSAVMKSDVIRIVARADVMIVSTNFDVSDKKLVDHMNMDEFACVVLKPNGDIILKPAVKGVVKVGGEDADLAALCIKAISGQTGGVVSAPPIVDTMAGSQGSGGANGEYATKVLFK